MAFKIRINKNKNLKEFIENEYEILLQEAINISTSGLRVIDPHYASTPAFFEEPPVVVTSPSFFPTPSATSAAPPADVDVSKPSVPATAGPVAAAAAVDPEVEIDDSQAEIDIAAVAAPGAPAVPEDPQEQGQKKWYDNSNIEGLIVRTSRKRQFGTKSMNNYLTSLGKTFPGLHIGDISKDGGGKISGHVSHQSGIDVDICIPTLGTGDGSAGCSIRSKESGKWAFRSAKKDIDYDATLAFVRHTAPHAKYIFLDDRFFSKLRKLAKKQVSDGVMSQEEYKNIFKVLHHEKGHHNHFHVRLNTPGIGDPKSSGRFHKHKH